MRVLRKILIYIAKNSRPSIYTVGRLAISRRHTCRCQEWEENSRRHVMASEDHRRAFLMHN
ncbi:hypothetical protein IC575_025177 [Cucumis melo]